MITFIKNIVFLFLTFNILVANASSVELDLVAEDEKYISAEFKGALNLPHPIIFKQLLDTKQKTSTGRLLAIAYYFDNKYKDNAIEYDFSEDVAIIFPNLTPQEVIDRTNFIRKAVKTFRWGKNKYADLAIKMATPEEPPLLVDDDEYAILGSVDYIPTPEGSFAVINDFKKVVSYSDNPKDMKAMEAYNLRKLEKKNNKTNFEKFKYMLNKLEFSKISSYGIDLPNPFIGNAGIGEWINVDGYKARSISELGQIHNTTDLIAGLHINTPSHRFMLANNLSNNLHKPKIVLTETQNIKSYKVFYPLSVPAIDDKMINAYSDDFVFPILIETINPNEPVSFNTKITFQDCDIRLECNQKEITAPLYIEKGIDNNSSAVKHFVRQSYYNLPNEEDKYIKIDNAYIDLENDNLTTERINFIFSYKEEPKNFSFLIEDDDFTEFSAPHINIHDDKIYVSVTPLSNQTKLLNKQFTVTTKLNAHSYIRMKVNPTIYSVQHEKIKSVINYITISYFSGLLFNIMPIGLMMLFLSLGFINIRQDKKHGIYYLIISAVSIVSSICIYLYTTHFNIPLYWGNQYNNTLYLGSCAIIILSLYLSLKYKQPLMIRYAKTKAALFGILLVLLIPFSYTPYLAQNFNYIDIRNITESLTFLLSTIFGVITPYLLIALWQIKYSYKKITSATNKWLFCIGKYAALLTILYFIGLFFLQMTFASIIKIILILLIYFLICKYFFNFIDALYQTDLSDKKKHIAENIIFILFAIFTTLSILKIHEKSVLKLTQTPILINQEQIDDSLRQNKNILVSITPNWSYTAKLNEIITLNEYTLNRLKKTYNLEFISIKAPYVSPHILQYAKNYNRYNIPIYVLYTIHMNKGIVLPKIVKDTELEKTIKNFVL